MSALEILSDFKKESSKDYLNSMVDLETKTKLSDLKISIEEKNETKNPRDIKDLYIEQTWEDAFVRKTIGRPKAPLIKKDPKNPVYGKPYTKEEYAIIDEYISKSIDNNKSTYKKIVKIIDPTGISNWRDIAKAWNDGKFDYKDIVDPLTAIPIVGKVPKIIKIISLGANTYSAYDE